ncbi:hypothetical protein KGF56_004333 [Candida oxycetoniae]|uniref:Uncharacterized protein n=1 Tax=Candida oxycetoniae TaxID=497107 RepID=A0AAI9WWC0_9ASCO|nr:uncharacterized protein KGF56_004333 [Candida oxycetoniae]KAI3402872.2 hypothetical protein KGF56_004333 [Candida oxycetoniae]
MLVEEVAEAAEVKGSKDIEKAVANLTSLHQPAERYYRDLQTIKSLHFINYEIVVALSFHSNPNLDWCSLENAQLVSSIIQANDLRPYLSEYVNQEFKPNLRKIENQVKSGLGRSGLRPRLIFQDQKFDPVPLAQAWFLIEVTKNKKNVRGEKKDDKDHNDDGDDAEINLLVLLLLIDCFQFDIQGKIQACKVLAQLKILTPKLVPQLRECLAKCLVHIPPVTPEESESLPLLTVALPNLYRVDDEFGTNLNYIDTIATILSSLTYVTNYPKTMIFLLQQLSVCINRIGIDVLISVSKIFYILNQIITNYAMLDKPEVVQTALKVENDILQVQSPLVYTFVFDLISAYAVLEKRIGNHKIEQVNEQKEKVNHKIEQVNEQKEKVNEQIEKVKEQIEINLTSLKGLAKVCDKVSEFEDLCTYIPS